MPVYPHQLWLKKIKGWLLATGLLLAGSALLFSLQDSHISLSAAALPAPTPVLSSEVCTKAATADFQCYERVYQQEVQHEGPAAAFVDLKQAYTRDPYVKSQCHQLTHVIGRAAAQKYDDLGVAYSKGDNFCWSGYYHGVMEAIVAKHPDLMSVSNTICASLRSSKPYSFDHYNCAHGLGHGFMTVSGDDLFKALHICDSLTDSWEAQSCYGGVFMENIMASSTSTLPPKYLKPDQPLYPCTAVATIYQNSCYLTQTSYALQVNKYQFGPVFALCASVDATVRPDCYQSMGRDASGQTVSNGPATKAICMQGPTAEAQTNCVIGAVKDFVSYFHGDKEATAFCQLLNPALEGTCDQTKDQSEKSF